jgi:hypothetical protein
MVAGLLDGREMFLEFFIWGKRGFVERREVFSSLQALKKILKKLL